MPKINVLNQLGENVGSLTLNEKAFGVKPNTQAMFDAVLVSQTNSRQDTSKTKKRAEVSGGGIKPYRQKGTGRARQGSTRAPQWRHGGIVFGPTGEQNHQIKMNKKVRQLALASALSSKVLDKELIVVDKIELKKASSKEFNKVLTAIKAEKKVLIVCSKDSMNEAAKLSARNLKNVYDVKCVCKTNVYDIMNCTALVMTKDAVKKIEEVVVNG